MPRKRVIRIQKGDVFGDLTVIEPVVRESDKSHQYFKCICTCGNEKIANGTSLLRGDLTSCGCRYKKSVYVLEKIKNAAFPIGYRSGSLVIQEDLGVIPIKSKKEHCYKCLCDCGNTKVIRHCSIKNGVQSCGCTRLVNSHLAITNNAKDRREYPDWLCSVMYDEEEKNQIKNKDLTYESEVKFVCSYCGDVTTRPISHIIRLNKDRETPIVLCLSCSNHRSSFEEEVYQYIRGILPDNIDIQRNVWNILSDGSVKYELDMYISDLHLAIECNGDYFHSEENGKSMKYHQKKFILSEERGIHLVQIFQSVWNSKKEKLKVYLRDMLGQNTRVYARKCNVVELSKKEAIEFYNHNHLQGGNTLCNITYVLSYNNTVVAAMSFSKTGMHDRKSMSDSYYELVRYAVLSGYTVVGGPSRLLHRFEEDYNPSRILSYSDNDFFSGNMYASLGFSLDDYTKPSYHWYLRDQSSMTREQCQLKPLSKKYPDLYEEALSFNGNKETFIMHKLRAVKVWHSGNKRWIKTLVEEENQ